MATALTVLLWVTVAASGFGLLALINQRAVGEDELDEVLPDVGRIDTADDLVAAAAAAVLLLVIAVAVVFIIWTWRVAKNHEALERRDPRLGPGWAIGGWFIPIANWVIPILMIQDFWRGSDPSVPRGRTWRNARGSGLVGIWWAIWIGAAILGFAANTTTNDSGEYETVTDFRTGNTLSTLGTLAVLVAAVLAISVVRQLTRRQEECLHAQQQAWQAEAPA